MSAAKNILILLMLYFFALIQSSFLVHFRFFGFFPNIILISIVAINFFESPEKKSGLFFAAFGGFLVDVFSERPFGINLAIYLIVALLMKFLLKNYVRVSFGKNA